MLEKKEVWILGKQRELYIIEMSSGGLCGGMFRAQPGDELLALAKCQSYWLLELYEVLREEVCLWPSL